MLLYNYWKLQNKYLFNICKCIGIRWKCPQPKVHKKQNPRKKMYTKGQKNNISFNCCIMSDEKFELIKCIQKYINY